ncbi:DUF5641 domain-containing protein [Nephila pilipes]|uniref:DUF5641 domain-containing protein n=1 Tax=Nephila pilipes TaxID=299642 RepID=A0A8X6TRK8_NEPPI|nr:DUF5641 domain-containing protein [Nephila pilipes]
MTEIPDTESEEEVGTYYIPYLGVYRPDKCTTKFRVVFNESSKTTLENSLNSLQYNGWVIQEDLFNIMTGFRKQIYAFVADIKQMYRMILIDPTQTKLQRILWREGVSEPVKMHEFKTVTYGTASAPDLANRVLLQLSRYEHENYP